MLSSPSLVRRSWGWGVAPDDTKAPRARTRGTFPPENQRENPSATLPRRLSASLPLLCLLQPLACRETAQTGSQPSAEAQVWRPAHLPASGAHPSWDFPDGSRLNEVGSLSGRPFLAALRGKPIAADLSLLAHAPGCLGPWEALRHGGVRHRPRTCARNPSPVTSVSFLPSRLKQGIVQCMQ